MAISAHSGERFTKRPGRERASSSAFRLNSKDHAVFTRLIRGDSERARNGRLAAWAAEVARLTPDIAIRTTDPLQWLNNQLRSNPTMRFRAAAAIFVAGLRSTNTELPNATEWITAVHRDVPSVPRFHYGYGIEGVADGQYGHPIQACLLPPIIVKDLTESIAALAVPRDRENRRQHVGEQVERLLKDVARERNSAGAFAVSKIVTEVVWSHFHRARLGTASDSAINNLCADISESLDSLILDDHPDAVQRLTTRIRERANRSRLRGS